MADWRTISVGLTADTAKYTSGLSKAAQQTRQFGQDTQQAAGRGGKSWSSFSSVLQGVALGVGINLASMGSQAIRWGVEMIQSGAQFQATMLNVQSLGGETEGSLRTMSQAIIDMSGEMPQSAAVLAEGLYDIESSGFQGAGALQVLEASAKSASAGMTDTATSARAITGVLNAYGMSAGDAGKVSDVLFQTVNTGVVSFEELAQNLGDVVPMAAAMGISLEEVTGALAAMTLAGLPAAEASTATARVMQAFIKPSEGMRTELAKLGLGLDDLKPSGIGLSGVMQRIAEDTGGSTVALQALFPDVRSLKGALALTANEGRNYARAMEAGQHATDGIGATQKAFDVQMQGIAMRWEVMKNKASGYFLTISTQVLPIVGQLAESFGSFIASTADRLSGVWSSLTQSGADLVEIIGDLARGAAPVAQALAGMVGAAVLGALSGLTSALRWTLGLLAQHPGAIRAVGMALAAWFVAGKIMAVGSALSFVLSTLKSIAATRGVSTATAAIEALGFKAGGASGALGALRGNLGNIARTGGVAVAIAAIAAGLMSLSKASDDAKKSVEATNDLGKGKGFQGVADALNNSAVKGREAANTINSYGNTANRVFHGVLQSMSPLPDTIARANAEYDKQLANNQRLSRQYDVMNRAVNRLAFHYGLTRTQVEGYLASDKDLNMATATTAEVNQSLSKTLQATADKLGITKSQAADLGGALTSSGMSLEDFTKALGEAQSAAGNAILAFGDLASHKFDLEPGQTLGLDKIKDFYADAIEDTRGFMNNITTLIKQGYDPGLVSRLLQAGPATAGPQVQALVSGYSASLVGYVNEAEKQISDISAHTAELARLNQLAIMSGTDTMAKSLPDAVAIMQQSWAGVKPVDIAKKLGLTPKEYNQIVTDFGIGIGRIEKTAQGAYVNIPVNVDSMGFDAQVSGLKINLDKLTHGNYNADVGMNIARFSANAIVVDQAITDLTAERDALIKTDAPQASIDAVNGKLEYLRRTREAIVYATDHNVAPTAATLDFLSRVRAALIEAGAPESKINEVEGQMRVLVRRRMAEIDAHANTSQAESDISFLVRGRTITIRADVDMGTGWSGLDQVVQQLGQAKGGVHEYAKGGLTSFASGGIGRNGPLYKWAEPETGGEAFIPKRGISQQRAMGLLEAAAGWHGLGVYQKGKMTPYASHGTSVNVSFGGIRVDASGSENPGAVRRAVESALDTWVKRNPRKLIAAIGAENARTGR